MGGDERLGGGERSTERGITNVAEHMHLAGQMVLSGFKLRENSFKSPFPKCVLFPY